MIVAVDIETAIRDWLRTQSALTSIATGGVFCGTPDKPPPDKWVSLWLVAEPTDRGDVPRTIPLVQFDCYAVRRIDAISVSVALVNTLWPLSLGGTFIAANVRCDALRITGRRWSPDYEKPQSSRYSVDAEFQITPTG